MKMLTSQLLTVKTVMNNMSFKEKRSGKNRGFGAGAVTSSSAGLLDRVLHYKFPLRYVFYVLGSIVALLIYLIVTL